MESQLCFQDQLPANTQPPNVKTPGDDCHSAGRTTLRSEPWLQPGPVLLLWAFEKLIGRWARLHLLMFSLCSPFQINKNKERKNFKEKNTNKKSNFLEKIQTCSNNILRHLTQNSPMWRFNSFGGNFISRKILLSMWWMKNNTTSCVA